MTKTNQDVVEVVEKAIQQAWPHGKAMAIAAAKACEDYYQSQLEAAREEVERLRELAKLGYELSSWAGSINWRGGENLPDWLDDLRNLIENYQSLYKRTPQETTKQRGE